MDISSNALLISFKTFKIGKLPLLTIQASIACTVSKWAVSKLGEWLAGRKKLLSQVALVPLLATRGEVVRQKVSELAQALLLIYLGESLKAVRIALAMGEVVQVVRIALFLQFFVVTFRTFVKSFFTQFTLILFVQRIPVMLSMNRSPS